MPYNDRPWEREANELMSEVAMKARELLANKKNVVKYWVLRVFHIVIVKLLELLNFVLKLAAS